MPHAKGRSTQGLLEVLRSACGPEIDRMGHWEAVYPIPCMLRPTMRQIPVKPELNLK